MFNKYFVFFLFSFIPASGQQIKILHEGRGVSLRGLSVVSEKLIWVSGSNGTVGRSHDGGSNWEWTVVPGFEKFDFRDIEAFSNSEAVIMASGEPSVILKTKDGGKSWKEVYRNDQKGMFLDAMDFLGNTGYVVGDPVNGKFFIAKTSNGGNTWKEIAADKGLDAAKGEACFAASGSNLVLLSHDDFAFVTGGSSSRLIWKNVPKRLSLIQGLESQGANSLAVWEGSGSAMRIAVVGGDFAADSVSKGNCEISRDGGKSWISPSNPPHGYRSCVAFITASKLVSCGTTGVDVSLDDGINWNSVSQQPFHVCGKARTGTTVFLAGPNGSIGKLIF